MPNTFNADGKKQISNDDEYGYVSSSARDIQDDIKREAQSLTTRKGLSRAWDNIKSGTTASSADYRDSGNALSNLHEQDGEVSIERAKRAMKP